MRELKIMSSATSCMGTNRVVFRIILGYNMGIITMGVTT
jgi:hypothetical protein